MPGDRGGRPRKPTALKLLTGEKRRARLPVEPRVKAGLPVMPADLPPRAQEAWRLVMVEIGEAGILKGIDRFELERYVRTWALWREAVEQLEEEGLLAIGRSGGRRGEFVKHPLHQITRDLATLGLALARSLGLTPSARAGLATGSLPVPSPDQVDEDDDPIARLMHPRSIAARRAAAGRARAG